MSALFGVQINQVMLFFGIGLFVFVMVNRLRRGTAQSSRGPRLGGTWRRERDSLAQAQRSRESIGSARMRSASASPDHESWEVEMRRLARELNGEIDTKMRALTQLIQLADEAHGRLDASLRRAESLGSNRQVEATIIWPGRATNNGVRGGHAGNSARPGPARPVIRDTIVAGGQNLGHEPGDDPRFQRVYALADAGFSATKIASQIGAQVGEVELILSMRDKTQVDAA
jgi:hypothetical protein